MVAAEQNIKILCRLTNGNMIVRTSWQGVRPMTRTELDAHKSCGVAVTSPRRLA